MTQYEAALLAAEPFLPSLRRKVRKAIQRLGGAAILDVGGRHSPYTVGLNAAVTVSDLPRTTAVQWDLHLGLTDAGIARLTHKRSNIHAVVFDDMTESALRSAAFDGVVAVEVLEHVEADDAFLRNVSRVLKPGGWFVMTTPNGEYKTVVTNPDHRRHYRRTQLEALLKRHFASVEVYYACPAGTLHDWSLPPWSFRKPFRTMRAAFAGALCQFRASGAEDKRTHHLFAVASQPHNFSTVIQQPSSVGAPLTAEMDSAQS